MATTAYLPIVADRAGACVKSIRFVGLDLTNVTLRMQVRLRPDTPGAPLIDLGPAASNAQGLAITSIDKTGPVAISTVQIRINESTMKNPALVPYMGEVGDPGVLAYDLIGTFGADKRRLIFGDFVALATVLGSDAAPVTRPSGMGTGRSWSTWSQAQVAVTDNGNSVTIDGFDLIAPLVASAKASADAAAAHLANFPDYYVGPPGGDAGQVGIYAAAVGMAFSAGITRIQTTGRLARGDGGAASYLRWISSMPALTAAQKGYSWFESTADGSRWVLDPNQRFVLPMFGAMGDPNLTRTTIAQGANIGTDDAAAINAALNAPMVKELIVDRQHWFGSDIRKPSGKTLRGYDRATCGFHRIPLVGTQAFGAGKGVYCEDDEGGKFSDFFINCQRSGWKGLPADDRPQLNSRCSGLIIRRGSKNVRATRIDVYNSWGYSHYTCSGDAGNNGPAPTGTVREDCRAYNGDTCFELTGLGGEETLINCWGYRDPIDGGVLVYMECAFHSYSGIARLHRIRCGFVGSAPAVLDATADGVSSGTIINEYCDWRTTGGQTAVIVTNPNPDNVRVNEYQIIGGRAVADPVYEDGSLPLALLVDHSTVTIDGGVFSGGISVSTDGQVTLKNGPIVTAYRPSGPVVNAIDIVGGSDGTVDWYGTAGVVAATHGENVALANAAADSVVFHDLPVISPAEPSMFGLPGVRYKQRLTGESPRSAWSAPGGGDAFFSLAVGLVSARSKLEVSLSLRCPDNTTNAPEASLSWCWLDDAAIRVTVSGYDTVPGGSFVSYIIAERL